MLEPSYFEAWEINGGGGGWISLWPDCRPHGLQEGPPPALGRKKLFFMFFVLAQMFRSSRWVLLLHSWQKTIFSSFDSFEKKIEIPTTAKTISIKRGTNKGKQLPLQSYNSFQSHKIIVFAKFQTIGSSAIRVWRHLRVTFKQSFSHSWFKKC